MLKLKSLIFSEIFLFLYFLNNKLNTILIKFKLKDDWEKFYTNNYLNEEIKNETLNQINKLNNFCLERI